MIFLAVVPFGRCVRDTCEACDAPGFAVLFTVSGPHWVKHTGHDHELYHGGPDVFVLCRQHAAEAEASMREPEGKRAHDQVRLTPHATFGRMSRG